MTKYKIKPLQTNCKPIQPYSGQFEKYNILIILKMQDKINDNLK